MTIRILTLLAVAAAWLFTGCDKSEEEDFVQQFVLEGYLMVGQPMSVHLSHTVPLGQLYDPAQVAVSGADVRIWAGGHEFALPEDTARHGTYSLPADSHIVTTGEDYRIRVDVQGAVLTAATHNAAGSVAIDSCNLPVWRDSTNMDTLEYGDTEFFLHWNLDSRSDGYWIITENLEPDWFEEWREVSGNNGSTGYSFWYWTERGIDEFKVPWIILSYTGRHRVRVVSCDEACYNYAFTSFPGDPENQPQSNVQGGLGVFCAIDVDTAYFYLADNIED